MVDFATSVRAKRKSCIQHHVYTKTYENTSIRVKFSVFFNKEDFAKTKSLDQRLPPLRKKIWSYPQYYSTIDDEHKCFGYSSVLFDSSCVTYIETFISKKLVQIYDLTVVKLKLNKPWFRGSFFKKPKFCFSLWHAHRNSSCSNDGFSATFC